MLNNGSTQLTPSATASVTDNPAVQTQDAPLSNTLIQDCGGCILGQIANDPNAVAILEDTNSVISNSLTYVAWYGASAAGGAGLELTGAFEAPEAIELGDIAPNQLNFSSKVLGQTDL